jgi:glutaredoxin
MRISFLLLTLIILIGCELPTHKNYKSYPGGSSEIVMYSLTTCGYCTRKREELKLNHIRFTEHFIDKDSAKNDEMRAKLSASGDTRSYITVPVFDVYGYMMTGNPSFKTIQRYIDKYKPIEDQSTGLSEYRG